MAARELRTLRITRGELVADAVEQLDVALLGILLEGRHKGPGHGTGVFVSTKRATLAKTTLMQARGAKKSESTNEVWLSLLPENITTSAGDVFVIIVLS